MEENFIKPKIIDEEILLDPNKTIMSKTDKFGVFEFANDYFMEISGYEEWELMGKSMFCVQHPDMPEIIFKHLWEKLLQKKEASVVVKNLTKSGKYYWSLTSFAFKINEKDGEIISIYSKRVAPNKESIAFFSGFYKTLLNIEKKKGVEAAEKYAKGFLEEKQTDLNGLVKSFYPNINKSFNVLAPKKTDTTTSSKTIEKITPKILEPKQTNIPKDPTPVKITPKSEPEKKSLFQKLFGKTEEEIEEERRRKEGKK